MEQDKIGKLIKKLREEKDMTQLELANKLNVSDRAISKWERGVGLPDISLLIPLANSLGISVDELLSANKMNNEGTEKIINYIIERDKKKKKKNIIKIIILLLILIVCFFTYLFINKTINNITYETININYINYIYNKNKNREYQSQIYNISGMLPLNNIDYKNEIAYNAGCIYGTNKDNSLMEYSFYNVNTYNIKEYYKDEEAVNKSLFINSVILFHYFDKIKTIKYTFDDYTYIINKEDLTSYKYYSHKVDLSKITDKNYFDNNIKGNQNLFIDRTCKSETIKE